MVRDDRKLVVVSGSITKPVLRMFTAAGEALAAFVWEHGRIAGMGWTNEQDLLIMEDVGEVCTQSTVGPRYCHATRSAHAFSCNSLACLN